MNTHEMNYWLQCSRICTIRRKKRMIRKSLDMKLIRLHKEEKMIRKEIRDLGWTELKPPVQRGFIRFFVLRDDVSKTNQAPFLRNVLDKINTTHWSYRSDFKKKRRKYGKKIYVVREQGLRDVGEKEFFSNKFAEQERLVFDETLIHPSWSKGPVKVYRFAEPWRFKLRIQPNMISKVRVKDFNLEQKLSEIGKYFEFDNRRDRLWRLLGDGNWKWDHVPKEKYKDPLRNKSFADILSEYLPEQQLVVSYKNPRKTRGFSFLDQLRHQILPSKSSSRCSSLAFIISMIIFLPFFLFLISTQCR